MIVTGGNSLASLLAPHDEAQFLSEILGESLLHVEANEDKFREVTSWADINRFLSFGGSGLSKLRLTKGDETLPEERYCRGGVCGTPVLCLADVTALLRDGAALHLDSADEWVWAVRCLCRSIEERLETPVSASLHATWADGGISPPCWNDHDVIALQIAGETRWQIRRPTLPFPTSTIVPPAPVAGAEYRDVSIKTGHLLYIPRGWWTVERWRSGAALTLNLTFRRPTGLDILARLIDRLSLVDFMRMDCPQFADPVKLSVYLTRIQQEFSMACTQPGVLLGFFKDTRAMFDLRALAGFPEGVFCDAASISEDQIVLSLIRFSDSIAVVPDADTVEVFCNHRSAVVSGFTGSILRKITERCSMPVRELLSNGDESAPAPADLRAAIAELVLLGAVVLQNPEAPCS